jgi:hypothetical protein
MSFTTTHTSDIDHNETVVCYPSIGHLLDDGQTWKISVFGTIYEPGELDLRKRIVLRVLRQVMKVSAEALATELFQQRIHCFIAATERGKRIVIRIGSREHVLQKRSKSSGQFSGTVRLGVDEVRQLQQAGGMGEGWLNFEVVSPLDNGHKFLGQAQLLRDTGVSVISDIDDTIKHSEVTSRRALLANTFLREFQPVEGMASLYRQWAEQGAAFHYVSSSPWQLYDPLAALVNSAGFPAGTFHLRSFRLRDHMLRRLFLVRRPGKVSVIKSILRTFPRRRFILVGDSGERDPELYGAVARKFPRQVASIVIRDLQERRLDSARRDNVFRHLPPGTCKVFQHPSEMSDRWSLEHLAGELRESAKGSALV